MDKDRNMFGMDRIAETLNADPDTDPESTLKTMRKELDGFVKDAEQFDDLTMMCIEYRGNPTEDAE